MGSLEATRKRHFPPRATLAVIGQSITSLEVLDAFKARVR